MHGGIALVILDEFASRAVRARRGQSFAVLSGFAGHANDGVARAGGSSLALVARALSLFALVGPSAACNAVVSFVVISLGIEVRVVLSSGTKQAGVGSVHMPILSVRARLACNIVFLNFSSRARCTF